MPRIQFSEDDVKRGTIVTPAWYRVRVDNVLEKPAKAPSTNTNYWIEGEILFDAETGDKKFAGVPTPYVWLFTTGALGNAMGFVAAIMGSTPELGKEYELKMAEGRELDVFIENEIYQGQMQNRINHKYRAPRNRTE